MQFSGDLPSGKYLSGRPHKTPIKWRWSDLSWATHQLCSASGTDVHFQTALTLVRFEMGSSQTVKWHNWQCLVATLLFAVQPRHSPKLCNRDLSKFRLSNMLDISKMPRGPCHHGQWNIAASVSSMCVPLNKKKWEPVVSLSHHSWTKIFHDLLYPKTSYAVCVLPLFVSQLVFLLFWCQGVNYTQEIGHSYRKKSYSGCLASEPGGFKEWNLSGVIILKIHFVKKSRLCPVSASKIWYLAKILSSFHLSARWSKDLW